MLPDWDCSSHHRASGFRTFFSGLNTSNYWANHAQGALNQLASHLTGAIPSLDAVTSAIARPGSGSGPPIADGPSRHGRSRPARSVANRGYPSTHPRTDPLAFGTSTGTTASKDA